VYRFSFSWSRILPDGDASNPNMEGVAFYHNLINEIIKQNLTPIGTVYHFDHPQVLEDQFRGWQSREMIDKFRDYARFVFKEYGSKVQNSLSTCDNRFRLIVVHIAYPSGGLLRAQGEEG
ncbi:Beta-glucosidase 10, partial [Frankliniella fusca]